MIVVSQDEVKTARGQDFSRFLEKVNEAFGGNDKFLQQSSLLIITKSEYSDLKGIKDDLFGRKSAIVKDQVVLWTASDRLTHFKNPRNSNDQISLYQSEIAACYQKRRDGEFKTMTEAVQCEHGVFEQHTDFFSSKDLEMEERLGKEQFKIAKKFDDGKISQKV